MNNIKVLLKHNYVNFTSTSNTPACKESLATILVNLTYYGYALHEQAFKSLSRLSEDELSIWWLDLKKELELLTGASRKIDKFVVYKNFPAEVLSKSETEYWIPQILMYWGLSPDNFTRLVEPRQKMKEQHKAIVLRKANKDTLKNIFTSYLVSPARWKDEELKEVLYLSDSCSINLKKIGFKENLVKLVNYMMINNKKVNLSTATDVLRLAIGLSDGDVSLVKPSKFKSFKKSEKRFFLNLLEQCNNLTEDVARRPELFKRLFHQLHPGDFAKRYPKVVDVYDKLYNDKLTTFNSQIEKGLLNKDVKVLKLLSERPGDFRRRLVHTLDVFGSKAATMFISPIVLDKLTTHQIVSLKRYLQTVNSRTQRVFPPNGNWNKLQVANARLVDQNHIKKITSALVKVLAERLPKVSRLDIETEMVKLPNNGDVSPYARGTAFPIPKEIKFIRTASYWKNGSVTWFDNGWNFFDQQWKSLGACCWTQVKFSNNGKTGAVFSGDPVNCNEMQGRAAQLIDLYPDELRQVGVRYAVWNILCYSKIPFSKAEDVFAALQWGIDPQKGKLFEPSRCQLSFPLTSEHYTKYVCCLDLHKNEMIYLDANLKSNVRSADMNADILEKNMPAFMEYINSLPSVYDLFEGSLSKKGDISVLYSDKDTELNNVSAYVFKPENKNNKFKPIDLNSLLI